MEPDDVAAYGRQSYWEERYNVEEHYDWFPSVHKAVVAALCERLASIYRLREENQQKQNNSLAEEDKEICLRLRVLHLGTGNSSLCADLYEAVQASQLPFTLEQVAMDYAPNVIEKMRAKYPPDVLPNTQWVVGDVRCLEEFHALGPFDVIIDKGTMDALEADKESQTLEEDIEKMLHGVNALLSHAKGYGTFMQITWVVPYMRLYYTKREIFSWGDQVCYSLLGESDMYRLFVYTVPIVRYSTRKKTKEAEKDSRIHRRSKSKESTKKLSKIEKEVTETPKSVVKLLKMDSVSIEPKNQDVDNSKLIVPKISNSHWSPTGQDYEALVKNLLLYRRDSLESVLTALIKERILFDESVKKMEEKIAEMYIVREEIRDMLQEGSTVQRKTLAEALSFIGDCNLDEKDKKDEFHNITDPTITKTNESKDDGEISL